MKKLDHFAKSHGYESAGEFIACWSTVVLLVLALLCLVVFLVYASTDSYYFDHIKTRRPVELFLGDETLVLTEYSLDRFSPTLFTYDDAGNPVKIHYVSFSNLRYLPYIEEVSPEGGDQE